MREYNRDRAQPVDGTLSMGWANSAEMASSGDEKKDPSPKAGRKKVHEPDWAAGLKQLYDSVVDEPLPDSFKTLLSRLDESDK